ncbi:site-specific integrase [Aequorivita antarctica]|uniref:Site-specific integrase n=1 Tax=Aequorivita antarctica TaxID=153266 RepID=A0A5C6YUX3_9FLAO|nr:site-specific integrase [Aequorivita antarctica]TXD71348.1 site-specific integrase [Aequorivita antarctica]SRX76165.1 Tyrosine recombinase XerD [Aequorivita antarctica]
MRTSSTFSILFWIYGTRAKNQQANIYARITLNGKRVNISLKQKTDIASWDAKRQKVKGNGQNAKIINFFLDETKSEIVNCHRDLRSEDKEPSAQMIKARYLGEDKKTHTIKDIIQYHNESIENKVCAKTLCHYQTTQKYVLKFIYKKYRSKDIPLKNLDFAFLMGFETFLRSHRPSHYQDRIGNNTIMKHIQRLRKMITTAYHLEWIERDPFVTFKPKHIKTQREFLTEPELSSIERFSSNIDRLSIVKDLFVFSCYTGISYVDIMKLTPHNIVLGINGKKWISAKRNKTGTEFKIPLLEKAESLIEKYMGNPRTKFTGALLPNISNQKLNSYLKEISDLCDIKKNLTFHMARHTFATTITLSNGVPIETVSKLLGHTKIATTQIYAKVVEKKISEDMELLQKKLK